MIYYAQSTGGFYTTDIHGAAIPPDATEITAEQHTALLAGQATGQEITADTNGCPVLTNPAPMPLLQFIDRAKASVRAARVTIFGTLAGIQSQALTDGDTATAQAISTIQTQLANLPAIDLSGCGTNEEVANAFAQAWIAIAATAPEKVEKAFNEVLG